MSVAGGGTTPDPPPVSFEPMPRAPSAGPTERPRIATTGGPARARRARLSRGLPLAGQTCSRRKARASPGRVTPSSGLLPEERATVNLFRETQPSVVYITTLRDRRVSATSDVASTVSRRAPAAAFCGTTKATSSRTSTSYGNADRPTEVTLSRPDDVARDVRRTATRRWTSPCCESTRPPEKLRPIPVGSSSDLQVGQSVLAIGNPFGLDYTLTTGVISALDREVQSIGGRELQGVIQTDAAINPGNSGGPLLDSSGRLIGVNTQIVSSGGAWAGIGFAIPVDTVNWVVPELVAPRAGQPPAARCHPRRRLTRPAPESTVSSSWEVARNSGAGRPRRTPGRSPDAARQPRPRRRDHRDRGPTRPVGPATSGPQSSSGQQAGRHGHREPAPRRGGDRGESAPLRTALESHLRESAQPLPADGTPGRPSDNGVGDPRCRSPARTRRLRARHRRHAPESRATTTG